MAAFESQPSLPSDGIPAVLSAATVFVARPCPYTSLSFTMYGLAQPCCFMTVARAAACIVSFGTTRTYVRLPVG